MNRSTIIKRIALATFGCAGLTGLLLAAPFGKEDSRLHTTAAKSIPDETQRQFSTTIREVSRTPKVLTPATNYIGQPVMASCSSCHTTTTPNREAHSGEQLLKFHQGMHFAHGAQSCLNCHNERDYDTLRLANGNPVEYVDVMTLCGQCHGPQLRDYQRGLHGGMNGHWDLNRGPRTRNNCIHCHDPHAPAFPLVQPVSPPKDRIAVPHQEAGNSH